MKEVTKWIVIKLKCQLYITIIQPHHIIHINHRRWFYRVN